MYEYVFGPVSSRRFGRSLGVSLVPEKICNFDCVYCEVGKTKKYAVSRAYYAKADNILAEFDKIYPHVMKDTDVVTVTGAGEPTLNMDLLKIVQELKKRVFHPLVILTNSTTINDKNVQHALSHFDIVVPSLDAVSPAVFENIDKPAPGIDVNKIVTGMIDFSHIYSGRFIVELLLVKGINDTEDELLKIATAVKQMRYEKVILGTVFRPPAHAGIVRLTDKELDDAYHFLMNQGVSVDKAGVHIGMKVSDRPLDETKEMLVKMLKMRPSTIHDLTGGLSITETKATTLINDIAKDNEISTVMHNGELYYSVK